MKVLLDTSVLVAALTKGHPARPQVMPWLEDVRAKVHVGIVASHSLAELYSVLTALPLRPRISPAEARQLIQQDVLGICEVVSLTKEDYVAVLDGLSQRGLTGGVTYDALLLHAARKAKADRVLTLNESHFKRVFPELADRIAAP